MSDIKTPTRYKGPDRRAPRADAAAEPYANLLKRGDKVGGRHAAITNSLYSFHSYKNWADKMRGSWDDKK